MTDIVLVAGVEIDLPDGRKYTLKLGDTWFGIGERECGDPRIGYEIMRLNQNNQALIDGSNRRRPCCPYCGAAT